MEGVPKQEEKRKLILLDPTHRFIREALEEKEIEYRVAIEILIAQNVTKIYYEEHMDSLPHSTASSRKLIAWLNDRYKNGKLVRQGIISKYKEKNSHHFDEDGFWNPQFFHSFIEQLFKFLVHPEVVTNKKTLAEFTYSLSEQEWKDKAVMVASQKMIEDLVTRGKLISGVATTIVNRSFWSRDLLSNGAGIIGRTFKNARGKDVRLNEETLSNVLDDAKDEFMDELKRESRAMLEDDMKILENTQEYQVFLKHREEIIKTLQSIIKEVTPHTLFASVGIED